MPWIIGYLTIGIILAAIVERNGFFEATHRCGVSRPEVTDCERAGLALLWPITAGFLVVFAVFFVVNLLVVGFGKLIGLLSKPKVPKPWPGYSRPPIK